MEELETKFNSDPETMRASANSLLSDFVFWYYSISPRKILDIWGGYLAATLHYFSIPLLLRTLFAHWHRDVEGYGRGFDFARYSRVFMMNLISRAVGFVMRSVIILFGLAIELLILIFGMVFLMFWLLAPALLPLSLVFGVKLLL